jgi:hypothetical protein
MLISKLGRKASVALTAKFWAGTGSCPYTTVRVAGGGLLPLARSGPYDSLVPANEPGPPRAHHANYDGLQRVILLAACDIAMFLTGSYVVSPVSLGGGIGRVPPIQRVNR